MGFLNKLFGTGSATGATVANRGIKSCVTSAVNPIIKKEDDPWEQRVVAQDREGLAKITEAAAVIAREERLGKPIRIPTEGKPPLA